MCGVRPVQLESGNWKLEIDDLLTIGQSAVHFPISNFYSPFSNHSFPAGIEVHGATYFVHDGELARIDAERYIDVFR